MEYFRTIEEAAAAVVASVINEAVYQDSNTFVCNDGADISYEGLSEDRRADYYDTSVNLISNNGDEYGKIPYECFSGDSLQEYEAPIIYECQDGDEYGKIPYECFSGASLQEYEAPTIYECQEGSQDELPCVCSSDILEDNDDETEICFCDEMPQFGCECLTAEPEICNCIGVEQICECLTMQEWICYMAEKIKYIIDVKWSLFCPYTLRFVKLENEENTDYYYFEAMFSKPTKMYPIPQVTVSVFFKYEKNISQCEEPFKMSYFLEGSQQVHDPEHVFLSPVSLVYVMKAKLTLFKLLERFTLEE